MSVAVAEVLARMGLFQGLDADDLAVAEKLVFVNRVAAGDTVCREGTAAISSASWCVAGWTFSRPRPTRTAPR